VQDHRSGKDSAMKLLVIPVAAFQGAGDKCASIVLSGF
jgi:hypothetical protein